MKKVFAILAIICLLGGCASTQCVQLTNSMNAAEASYQAAKASGAPVADVEKWKWTYDAARAAVIMWCSTLPTETKP